MTMTWDEFDDFMQRVADDPHPCIHGHINCSDYTGGPCCDEEYPDYEEKKEDEE